MWQIYAIVANDLIRERRAEAEAESLRRAIDMGGSPGQASRRPGLVRRTSAATLRRIESGAAAVSRRASSTASRIEGEPA